MTTLPVQEVLIGVYLGLLASLFPSLIAFSIGFGFKYFTNVTVPGLGVVVLGGALAGISGGLMALNDPTMAESWSGITAILVILMGTLWAHSQGDKLGTAIPRKLTLKRLREAKLSTDIAERVDTYGQIRIRPIGGISDIEGYPPLPDDLREKLNTGSWKFPAKLSLSELESRLEERLVNDHELAEVSVAIDRNGRAQISAAPTAAGLSRRVPPGKRAVTIQTLLPTGIARGDIVTLRLPDGEVSGPVVSARTNGFEAPPKDAKTDEGDAETDTSDDEDGDSKVPSKAPTTTGGEGQISVAVSLEDARKVIRSSFAPVVVHSRGKQREFEVIGVLKQHGNRFRKVTVGAESPLAAKTIGDSRVRDSYGVAILAIRRSAERILAPRGQTELRSGDVLFVVGKTDKLRGFEEVVE